MKLTVRTMVEHELLPDCSWALDVPHLDLVAHATGGQLVTILCNVQHGSRNMNSQVNANTQVTCHEHVIVNESLLPTRLPSCCNTCTDPALLYYLSI